MLSIPGRLAIILCAEKYKNPSNTHSESKFETFMLMTAEKNVLSFMNTLDVGKNIDNVKKRSTLQ